MKLELKHLCSYLPYKLKMIWSDGKVCELDPEQESDCYADGKVRLQLALYSANGALKPLLLPLSALTEEIEHNGERFVPIEWLNENKDVRLIRGRDSRGNRIVFNERTNTTNIRFWEYCIIEKLAEWHIDIFQLIPVGLAVDKREVG